MLSSAAWQVSSGMQILAVELARKTNTTGFYDCSGGSALSSPCSANRCLGKYAHHAQCPPTFRWQSKQPQLGRNDNPPSSLPSASQVSAQQLNFKASLGILAAPLGSRDPANERQPGMIQGNTGARLVTSPFIVGPQGATFP